MKKFILGMGAVALMLTIASCSGNHEEKEKDTTSTETFLVEDTVYADTVMTDSIPADTVTE